MSFLINFGKNLKRIRISKGLSQEKLAELVGLGAKSLSPVETGKSFLSVEKLERICDVLKISPVELFIQYELSDNSSRESYLTHINDGLKQLNEKELKTLSDLLFTYIEKNR